MSDRLKAVVRVKRVDGELEVTTDTTCDDTERCDAATRAAQRVQAIMGGHTISSYNKNRGRVDVSVPKMVDQTVEGEKIVDANQEVKQNVAS